MNIYKLHVGRVSVLGSFDRDTGLEDQLLAWPTGCCPRYLGMGEANDMRGVTGQT